MPNSSATCVADLPLVSHSSTARCLKATSNFFLGILVSITGLIIRVLFIYVFRYLCPSNRGSLKTESASHPERSSNVNAWVDC